MPEPAAWLLLAALAFALAGMGWLALSLPAHAQQAWGRVPATTTLRLHRLLGASALLAALVLCLYADHATMAVLVWAMAASGAALAVAFVLSSRPRWLRWLAPWMRAPARDRMAG